MRDSTRIAIDGAAFGTIIHSGYVVFRALDVRSHAEYLGIGFWDVLRLAAASELPLWPLAVAAAIVLSWLWQHFR